MNIISSANKSNPFLLALVAAALEAKLNVSHEVTRSQSRFDFINTIVHYVQSLKQNQKSNMFIFNRLCQSWITTETSRVSTAALCTVHNLGNQSGWMIQDGEEIQRSWCDLDCFSQCELTVMEKKNKRLEGGERNRRGNEYFNSVKERNVSFADLLCFPFLSYPTFFFSPFSSSTLHSHTMPKEICRQILLRNWIEGLFWNKSTVQRNTKVWTREGEFPLKVKLE